MHILGVYLFIGIFKMKNAIDKFFMHKRAQIFQYNHIIKKLLPRENNDVLNINFFPFLIKNCKTQQYSQSLKIWISKNKIYIYFEYSKLFFKNLFDEYLVIKIFEVWLYWQFFSIMPNMFFLMQTSIKLRKPYFIANLSFFRYPLGH